MQDQPEPVLKVLVNFLWHTPIRLIKCNWCNCVMMDGSLASTIACWKINNLTAREVESMQRLSKHNCVNGRLNSIHYTLFQNSEWIVLKFHSTPIINCFPSLAPVLEESVWAHNLMLERVFKNKPGMCARPHNCRLQKLPLKLQTALYRSGACFTIAPRRYMGLRRARYVYVPKILSDYARHHLIYFVGFFVVCLSWDQTRLEFCNVPRNRPRRKSRRPTSLHKFRVTCTCLSTL
jgi:hypothetical protein